MKAILMAAGFLALASAAKADPCAAPVGGYKPETVITGTVRAVLDGDSICAGPTADPATWVEVRLADFSAPELNESGGRFAKIALARVAMGRRATCTVQRGRSGRVTSFDRVIASCRIGGVGLADAMRRAGVREGGR